MESINSAKDSHKKLLKNSIKFLYRLLYLCVNKGTEYHLNIMERELIIVLIITTIKRLTTQERLSSI